MIQFSLKNHTKKGKLDVNWKPFWRVIKKTSPVTYIIKHQLDGSFTKVHAENIRKANFDNWVMPNTAGAEGRILGKANYVVPPRSDESDKSTSSLSSQDMTLPRITKRYRKE